MISNQVRIKLELAALATVGISGLLIGNGYINPSGAQRFAITALGSATAGALTCAAVSALISPIGSLRLELGKAQTRVRVLEDRAEKDSQQAKEVAETCLQLQDAATNFDAEMSEAIAKVQAAEKLANDWQAAGLAARKVAGDFNEQIKALDAELKAAEQKQAQAIETLKQEHSANLHREIKAALQPKLHRMYENYQKHAEKEAAELKEQQAIELGRYQSRVDELKTEIEALEGNLAEVSNHRSDLTTAFESLVKTDLPDVQATFEREWLQNDQLLQNAIEQLRQKNAELQAPRMFPGTTAIDITGNRIIQHFANHEVCLDAIESVTIPSGFKLRFKFDRTNSYLKMTEEEFDKRVAEPGLMGLSYAPLDFVFDARNFIVSVDIATSVTIGSQASGKAETASEEIELADFYRANNLLPASEFSQVYKKLLATKDVPSVRVNGETGSGKSSVVRLLLSEALKAEKTRIRLHDPQSGSAEDRWGFAAISKDAQATSDAMSTLLKRVEEKNPPPVSTIDIFDEIDSTMRKDAGMKTAYLSTMTQVRHLENQRMIVIGQNPKAGRGGLEWSDLDGCGSIYIGDSAIHAIKGSPKLSQKKDALNKQYVAIQEFCQARNTEQGLDGSEPNAFRFALVSVPRKAPFWIELPPFSEGVEPRENLVTGTIAPPSARQTCPHCGSDDLKINKKSPAAIQYRCKSCSRCHSIKNCVTQ
jgi:hypothetical protein